MNNIEGGTKLTNNEHVSTDDQVPVEKQTIFKEESADTTATATEKKPTSVGLEENIAALLSHIPIIGLIFFFIEKENKFVRFHSLQVIMLSIVLTVVGVAVAILTTMLSFMKLGFLGLLISVPFYFIIMPATFFLFVYMAFQAYKGKTFKLPIIGKFSEEHSVPK